MATGFQSASARIRIARATRYVYKLISFLYGLFFINQLNMKDALCLIYLSDSLEIFD